MAREVVPLIARTRSITGPVVEVADDVPVGVDGAAAGGAADAAGAGGDGAGGGGNGGGAGGGNGGAAAGTGAGAQNQQRGVFLTAESLTFPGATIVVTTLLALINVSIPGASTSVLWALGVSLVIGIVIIVLGMPAKGTGDSRQRFGFIAVGLINILLLTASALGINAYTQSESVSVTPDQSASDSQ